MFLIYWERIVIKERHLVAIIQLLIASGMIRHHPYLDVVLDHLLYTVDQTGTFTMGFLHPAEKAQVKKVVSQKDILNGFILLFLRKKLHLIIHIILNTLFR